MLEEEQLVAESRRGAGVRDAMLELPGIAVARTSEPAGSDGYGRLHVRTIAGARDQAAGGSGAC